jgi:hypothetical protein
VTRGTASVLVRPGPTGTPRPRNSGIAAPPPRAGDSSTRHPSWWQHRLEPDPRSANNGARIVRVSANLVGAVGAAYFAKASLEFYLQTHRLIGAAFLGEQTWIVVAYLIRRPARAVSRRIDDWLLAFGGVLFRPVGAHPHWGVTAGLAVQLLGLCMCVASFLTLGRSFGFAAADRGLVGRGPYAVVRHPIYASYLLLQAGYVLEVGPRRLVFP